MAAAAAAAAAAKVLRGGRSGFSSRLLGSSTAHKGPWRNPALSDGVNVKVPERMEQLCSKRSLHVEPKPEPPKPEPKREPRRERVVHHPMVIICLAASGFGVLYTLPANYRGIKGCFEEY